MTARQGIGFIAATPVAVLALTVAAQILTATDGGDQGRPGQAEPRTALATTEGRAAFLLTDDGMAFTSLEQQITAINETYDNYIADLASSDLGVIQRLARTIDREGMDRLAWAMIEGTPDTEKLKQHLTIWMAKAWADAMEIRDMSGLGE